MKANIWIIENESLCNIKDILIFEGEYSNGERNGKGKEYMNYELIYKGEYFKGKRWNGKGKEFDNKGNLTFEGEHINGEKNGKGKEYYLVG